MKAHELTITKKANRKRVGRGISAGGGKTAGRGTKGQKSRTGKKIKLGFEGGQTKLSARLPKKRGFTSKNPTNYQPIGLDQLTKLKSKNVDKKTLMQAGFIKNEKTLVKILNNGDVTSAYTVKVDAISAAARTKIEKAGGSVEVVTPTVAKSPQPTDNKAKK